MLDKCEHIWRNAYGLLKKKKKQHEVCVLSEYHKVNSVYGRIDRHLVGLQNRSAGVCLFKSSSQPAWEGSPELQDLPRTDLISLQVLLSLSLFNIQPHPQPLSPYFILPI